MPEYCWADTIETEMRRWDETWSDVVASTLTWAQLHAPLGGDPGPPFTLWTLRRVYFSTCEEGLSWVSSVSRYPDHYDKAVKAERLNLELAHRKGELVEIERVKAGLLARERALVAILEHKPEELASLLEGKTRQEIKPVLAKFAEDLRREWVAAAERQMEQVL
jgi:hypothetical protein